MEEKLDNDEDISLRSEETTEVLSRPPHWLVCWGSLGSFVIFIFVIFLSWQIKYPDFIKAKIFITAKTPIEKIETKVNGRITHLFVKNHQIVKKGEILALIENAAHYKDVLYLKDLLEEYSPLKKTDLFFFPLDKTINFSLGDIDVAYSAFEKAYTEYKSYMELMPHFFQLKALKVSFDENKKILEGAKEQLKLKSIMLDQSEKDLERSRKLFKEGVLSTYELERKNLEYLGEKSSHRTYEEKVIEIKEKLNAISQNLKKEQIDKKKEDQSYFKTVIRAYYYLKSVIKEWEIRYILKSSIDGLLSFQKYWGENQFVNTGEVIMSILPKSKKMRVIGRLTLPANNMGKIKKRQNVWIKLDNYPYQEFGQILGKVDLISIAADKQGDYYIEVILPKKLKTTFNKDIPFNQEMSGRAEIVTEEMRIIERIFHKFRKIFQYN